MRGFGSGFGSIVFGFLMLVAIGEEKNVGWGRSGSQGFTIQYEGVLGTSQTLKR